MSGAKDLEWEPLAPHFTLKIPKAFIKNRERAEILDQLEKMAGRVARNVEAMSGLYLRICEAIRETNIPVKDARAVLSKHFNKQKTSELLRISKTSKEEYLRYRTELFRSKAAVPETLSNQRGTGGARW